MGDGYFSYAYGTGTHCDRCGNEIDGLNRGEIIGYCSDCIYSDYSEINQISI